MLTEKQFPYTGPLFGPADSRGPSKSPTVEALKRAMGRIGLMDWTDYDMVYGLFLEKAVGRFQAMRGIKPASGQYGKGTWEALRDARVPQGRQHAGEYALDRYARWMVQAEANVTAESSVEEKVQEAIVEFCEAAIRNEPRIHYSQYRPVRLGIQPDWEFNSDCSGIVIQAFDYARRKTKAPVPDPAIQGWSGYGNTDLYEDNWPKVGAPFRVGDLGHFHSSRHVILCIKAGDTKTAEWLSHGKEAGPERVRLATYYRYPWEWMFAVRPVLVENV
jgi:hypothetical protein